MVVVTPLVAEELLNGSNVVAAHPPGGGVRPRSAFRFGEPGDGDFLHVLEDEASHGVEEEGSSFPTADDSLLTVGLDGQLGHRVTA